MGSNETPEDILWKAHEAGIGMEVMEEMSRIRHAYPYDLTAAYTQAYANVTASKAEEKRNGEDAIYKENEK